MVERLRISTRVELLVEDISRVSESGLAFCFAVSLAGFVSVTTLL